MKILIYCGSCAKHSYSFIAPLRIARVLARYNHEVKMIDWADERIPAKVLNSGIEEFKWGMCWTLPLHNMLSTLIDQIDIWKPDIIYSMGITHFNSLQKLCKKYSIPLGLHVGDPYYAEYPSRNMLDLYRRCTFLTFNEGQAWNFVRLYAPDIKEKCYLLNHAIDPELAPTWEQVQKIQKKYICSIVGGDDRLRRRELLLYYYQWTDQFPEAKFATGGSLTKGATSPYIQNDLDSRIQEGQSWNCTTCTDLEVHKFKNKLFNLQHIPNDLTYPLGLSHQAVHKLYSESYYGFTPFGKYLVDGRVSEFNTKTFGTKLLEQIGCGCAAIANNIKDLDQIIKHGKTGFILKTPKDAYDAFKLAIEKPEEIRQMGLKAYKFAHKFHSWDNRYEEVLKVIFKKLGGKV